MCIWVQMCGSVCPGGVCVWVGPVWDWARVSVCECECERVCVRGASHVDRCDSSQDACQALRSRPRLRVYRQALAAPKHTSASLTDQKVFLPPFLSSTHTHTRRYNLPDWLSTFLYAAAAPRREGNEERNGAEGRWCFRWKGMFVCSLLLLFSTLIMFRSKCVCVSVCLNRISEGQSSSHFPIQCFSRS